MLRSDNNHHKFVLSKTFQLYCFYHVITKLRNKKMKVILLTVFAALLVAVVTASKSKDHAHGSDVEKLPPKVSTPAPSPNSSYVAHSREERRFGSRGNNNNNNNNNGGGRGNNNNNNNNNGGGRGGNNNNNNNNNGGGRRGNNNNNNNNNGR
ncbi:putative uncharacterized protein DDB_G0283051 [Folsomia candida]|uniref:putative uncharacterized protein DDB_G0283051 n=1 Tax=Folsomia candida TaxID=158441 RepID=UPI001604A584|nr:putative uncharacterized protein DDB_G0283051 [Folsomia candida]